MINLISRITNNSITDMYTEKPEIKDNGERIFKKHKSILRYGILCICSILILGIFYTEDIVEIIMTHNEIDSSLINIVYICAYIFIVLFLIFGISVIVVAKVHKIIVSKNEIRLEKVFSTKVIKIPEIKEIANGRGIVIKGNECKICFGIYTVGLVEFIRYLERNVPKEKQGKTLEQYKQAIRNRGIMM